MNRLKKIIAEINPASQVPWLQSMNYSRLVLPKLISVFAMDADDFKRLISCARHLSDFRGYRLYFRLIRERIKP
jgi:hypothetical protein